MNRFKKTVKKQNATSGYISMPASEIDKEYYVLSKKELELIIGKKVED